MDYKTFRYPLQRIGCLLLVSSIILLTTCTDNSLAKGSRKLATVIINQGKGYSEAITEYLNIIEQNPKDIAAYYNLAMIIEIVLADYESSILLYDKALSISETMKEFFIPGQEGIEGDDINAMISKIKERRESIVQKIFSSIEGVIFPRYVVLKSGKTMSLKPVEGSQKFSKSSIEMKREFRFLNIKHNRCQVITTSDKTGWVKWDDICLIYQNSNERIMTPVAEKVARYNRFSNNFPDHKLAQKALKRMVALNNQQEEVSSIGDKNGREAENTSIQGDVQKQLSEVEERYRNGLISTEERKRLRMDILRKL